MPEQQCENSQTNPCPRTDTRLFTTMIEGTCICSIWLCPEHTRPEWPSDDEAPSLPVEVFDGIVEMVRFVKQGLADGTLGTVRRADTPPPGREAE